MNNDTISPLPFLKWAGSKKQLLPQLKRYWDTNNFHRYIEPFAGSAQLYFAINPQFAILNDINTELINTYKVIKINPTALYKSLIALPQNKEYYYELRKSDLTTMTDIEKAARFIYLNKLCFNGLYRTNLKGEFNVPYSGSKPSRFPTEQELVNISMSLSNTELMNDDFESLLNNHSREGDFVYMDPPYALANSKIFHQYNAVTFGSEDIRRMQSLLQRLDNKGVHFLLSYADSDDIIDHFHNWNIQKVTTRRNIAGFSRNRRIAQELLISNCNE